MNTAPVPDPRRRTRIISIASGKGGVGKTNVTVNLAWALASLGRSVLVLDADLGLSNVDILLGIRPRYTLEDVLFSGVPMSQAILNVSRGVDLISGASGVSRLAELSRTTRLRLVNQFKALQSYDYILIDNSPGITAQVTSICLSSKDIIIVVNPEATSITDAYALIKVLSQNGLWWMPSILVNRSRSTRQARLIFEKLRATAGQRLGINCSYLGHIPEDRRIASASAFQRPLIEMKPDSPAAAAISGIAMELSLSAEGGRGRDITPHRFLDASIMRIKQHAPREALPLERSAPVLRHAIHELSRIDALVDSLENPVSRAQNKATVEMVRERLSALRQNLQEAGSEEPRPASNNRPKAYTPDAPKYRAMLICPDEALQDVLVEMLADAGFTTDITPSPAHGTMPDFAPYSLAVVGWDGPAHTLERLAARAEGVPMVWLRGYRRPPDKEPLLPENRVTIIDKPFSVSKLRGTFKAAAVRDTPVHS